MTKARLAGIERLKKVGFTHNAATGRWTKGEGKNKVESRGSSELMGSSFGTPFWNPAKDAVAFRLHPGCQFIGPNRYLTLDGQLVDAMGAFKDKDECPECGSLKGEWRFSVRVSNPNPFSKPWEQAFTYCRRCCTPEEQAKLREPVAQSRK